MVTAALSHAGVPTSSPEAGAVPSPPLTVANAGPQDVLSLARSGDEGAFASIVRRHQNMVFSIALHTLRNRPAAEDLTQEVFLSLYRSLSKIDSDAHLVSWLRRVTSHRCIDEIRRREHRQEFAVDTLPDAGDAPQPREIFAVDRLRTLVAALPSPAQLVVVLRYQEDMDPAEIAETLNMPVNTVKSHLRRAVAALRERWTGERR